MRLPDPAEQSQLLDDLQKEHEKQLAADKSGDVKKYGSSCLLHLQATSSEESASDGESDDTLSCSDNAEGEEEMTCSVQTAAEPSECLSPEEFYSRHVVLDSAAILALEE